MYVFQSAASSAYASADAADPAGDGAARKARVADLVSAVVVPAREALEASLAAK